MPGIAGSGSTFVDLLGLLGGRGVENDRVEDRLELGRRILTRAGIREGEERDALARDVEDPDPGGGLAIGSDTACGGRALLAAW